MTDHVIDTNVLLVATAHDETSVFKDTNLPLKEREEVFKWLAAFRADAERCMVLDVDDTYGIIAEYKNQLGEQDYGYHVLLEKQSSARLVLVDYDHEGYAVVPEGLAKLDKSDKKMAAAVLAYRNDDAGESTIVNACDSDWYEHQEALEAHGVIVEQIIPVWSREKYEDKHPEARRKKPRWVRPVRKP